MKRSGMKNRMLSLALCLALCVSMLPGAAMAAPGVSYFTDQEADQEAIKLHTGNFPSGLPREIDYHKTGIISATVTLDCSITDEQWISAINNSTDVQEVAVMMEVAVPAGATHFATMGSDYIDPSSTALPGYLSDALDSLTYQAVSGSGNTLMFGIPLADVQYNNGTATVTPQDYSHSVLIKWKDNSGNQYYRCINRVVSHSSHSSIQVPNAAPTAGRVHPQDDGDATGALSNNVLDYLISNPSGGDITTLIESPGSGVSAVGITVAGKDTETKPVGDIGGGEQGVSIQFPDNTTGERRIRLDWKDAGGATLYSEKLIINFIQAGSSIWPAEKWVPSPERDTTAVGDYENADSLEYDGSEGKFTFSLAAGDSAKLDAFTSSRIPVKITPPAGAAKYALAEWNCPLYFGGRADEVKRQLDAAENRYDVQGGAVEVRFPAPMYEIEVGDKNATVYLTNTSRVGHADIRVIQWYDANGTPIDVDGAGDKLGHYVYIVYQPGQMESVPVASARPGENQQIGKPTGVRPDGGGGGHQIESGVIPHKDEDSNWDFHCWDLEYVDGSGESVNPGGEVEMWMPYPNGFTYDMAVSGRYQVRLDHYKDGLEGTGQRVQNVSFEPNAIVFTTSSFSPFLLSWAPVSSSSSDRGPGASYLGGGRFSASSAPDKVMVDGADVAFTWEGGNVVLNVPGLASGQHTVTMRWGGRTYTTFFTYEGGVEIAIPKTGDVSILPLALLVIAVAAQRRRRP